MNFLLKSYHYEDFVETYYKNKYVFFFHFLHTKKLSQKMKNYKTRIHKIQEIFKFFKNNALKLIIYFVINFLNQIITKIYF
jgi:hypothetical protein